MATPLLDLGWNSMSHRRVHLSKGETCLPSFCILLLPPLVDLVDHWLGDSVDHGASGSPPCKQAVKAVVDNLHTFDEQPPVWNLNEDER